LPQVAELKELLGIAREYTTGLRLELLRKSLGADAERARAPELAAYFTHCNLQPAHLMLALRSAMTLTFKAKLKRTAASFARRLLELNPKPEFAQTVRRRISIYLSIHLSMSIPYIYIHRYIYIYIDRDR